MHGVGAAGGVGCRRDASCVGAVLPTLFRRFVVASVTLKGTWELCLVPLYIAVRVSVRLLGKRRWSCLSRVCGTAGSVQGLNIDGVKRLRCSVELQSAGFGRSYVVVDEADGATFGNDLKLGVQ